ncbi:odorant receptor 2a-like isoform X2 [Tribolium madens]|uniref:odorant receptor 2a-like isoform X2 n=1 Tax=Tribolium madens TaxID=41895 RepID=UPI001CF76245|nr:odorant receptor 2a-like isoform X2 [Tribolium madens]
MISTQSHLFQTLRTLCFSVSKHSKPPLNAFKNTILLMKIIGMWKYKTESPFYKTYKYIMTIYVFLTCILCLVYTYKKYNDPQAIFFISYLPSIFTVPIKLVMFPIYSEKIKQLLDILDPQKAVIRTENQKKILENSIKLSNKIFNLFGGSFVAAAVGITATPLNVVYYGIFGGTLCFDFHLIAVNAAGDFFFYISAIQIEGRLDLIIDTFLNLEEISAKNENSNEEQKYKRMHEIVIECVQQYNKIIECSQLLIFCFKEILINQLICSCLSLMMTMYQLNAAEPFSLNFFRVIFYGIAMGSEIFLFCYFGNRLIVKCEILYYSIFKSTWYKAPLKIQKDLLIFMQQVQKPVTINVGNIFPLNYDTFKGIMQKSWSFFVALKNTQDLRSKN